MDIANKGLQGIEEEELGNPKGSVQIKSKLNKNNKQSIETNKFTTKDTVAPEYEAKTIPKESIMADTAKDTLRLTEAE